MFAVNRAFGSSQTSDALPAPGSQQRSATPASALAGRIPALNFAILTPEHDLEKLEPDFRKVMHKRFVQSA
ncbi:hypothetical protein [Bradyrhizobium sp. Ai1a-2]|uniref:hypothetical protein n=1 Tax=Bradyrhizobium sp. Ai1a-2 TaxID=196490 RepID=UPI0004004C17|nr:hypothetical protein [Bradyrhizobium sp. Ai1a-2]